jgi:ADP-heptose:LPS heptosyltransferase
MPLLQGSPVVDEVLEFPRRNFRGLGLLSKLPRWLSQWRLGRSETEWVLDFQGLLRSALISSARGSGPRVGLSDAREGAAYFYTHTVPVDAGAHAVDRYLELPRALGCPVPNADSLRFELPAGKLPEGWPSEDGPVVVLHPWSRGQGKSLSAGQLQSLCEQLAPHRVVVVGRTESESAPDLPNVTDLTNRTQLTELIAVMREATFCISVDSGPMHIAAAVNSATLGIHTWTDPRQVGPYDPRCWVWKAGRIDHRNRFSESECKTAQAVDDDAVALMAAFVRGRLREKH